MSDVQVKKHSDRLAKVFLIIPLIFFAMSVLCFVGGSALEQATSRGIIYTFLILGAFIFFGLDLIPGAIFAVIGMIRAAKAKMTGFLVLGIIEVIGACLSLIAVYIIVFVTGPGV